MKSLFLYWFDLNRQQQGALFAFVAIWSLTFLLLALDEVNIYANQVSHSLAEVARSQLLAY